MAGPWQSAFDRLRDLLGLQQIVVSPHVPDGQFLLYGAGAEPRLWEPVQLTEPLWPPAPPLPFRLADLERDFVGMGRDVYEAERELAFAHLAGLLDDACDGLGFDREVWRGPRREETRRLFHDRQLLAIRAEARYGMSIRPTDFAKITLT